MSWERVAKRAIIHVDADAFFASCEQALHPEYRGKPVITGAERGIVSAASYEAKARGVIRGVPLGDVKKICPDAIIVPSDYESYSLFSKRMFEIIGRFTSEVEEYGIDEAFADLTGLRRPLNGSYPVIAHRIKETIEKELQLSISIGLAPSKVLAKIGSKWDKPHGFVVIAKHDTERFLRKTPVGYLWGVGPQTTHHLGKLGITTAWEFAQCSEAWVKRNLTKPHQEIWHEINGRAVMPIHKEKARAYQSISKTKTFTPSSRDKEYIFAQLTKNVENAFIKVRRHGLAARWLRIFLKTQEFQFSGMQIVLNRHTAFPKEVIPLVRKMFEQVFDPKIDYRATGVILSHMQTAENIQRTLFESPLEIAESRRLYAAIDAAAKKFGKHAVFLGSSLKVHRSPDYRQKERRKASNQEHTIRGFHERQFLGIPLLGEVR